MYATQNDTNPIGSGTATLVLLNRVYVPIKAVVMKKDDIETQNMSGASSRISHNPPYT